MRKARRARGFTLLELLVVLAIVAMTAGLTLPAAKRWIDAGQERAWRQDVVATLTGLPAKAFSDGRELQLDAIGLRQAVASLPPDSSIELSAPLRYNSRGIASAATVRIKPTTGPSMVLQVEALTGRVSSR